MEAARNVNPLLAVHFINRRKLAFMGLRGLAFGLGHPATLIRAVDPSIGLQTHNASLFQINALQMDHLVLP